MRRCVKAGLHLASTICGEHDIRHCVRVQLHLVSTICVVMLRLGYT